jgi:RNA polymerase sigma-70 factor (ECF subfamily)
MSDAMTTQSDELTQLAARAQRGDRTAFDELVVRARPQLVRFLGRTLNTADADDAAQETFVRAFRALDRYESSRPFTTWLFAIAKNVAYSHHDASRRRSAREAAAAPAETTPADAAERASDDAAALWERARRVLSADGYHALYLRYVRGLAVKEVAHELGRSVVATKVVLFRARQKLLRENVR